MATTLGGAMIHEEVRKEALEFLGDELRLAGLRKRKQQENWHDASKKLASASTNIKAWQLWRHIQQFVAAHKMSRADVELRKIVLREMGIQRAVITLKNGYAPDEATLNVFQGIANEAHVAARRIAGVTGVESERISERANKAHRLTSQLRVEYRAAYCRAA